MIIRTSVLAATILLLAGQMPSSAGASNDAGEVETYFDLIASAEEKVREEKWEEAAALWERVAGMNPHDGRYWSLAATARQRARQYREAIPALSKLLEIGFGYPFNAAYGIAVCHARLGEKDNALAWLERAFSMGYRNTQAARSDENLKLLHDEARFKKLLGIADTAGMTRDEGWRHDLAYLAAEIARLHYQPFRVISRAEFEEYVESLNREIPTLSDNQIIVRLMKLMRLVGDGHTSIAPAQGLTVPVEFYLFEEGLYITTAAPEHADLVGLKVVAVGGRPIDEVLRGLEDIISRDNSIWPKFVAPRMLRAPLILNGLGLSSSDSELDLQLADPEGKTRSVTLKGRREGPAPDWVDVRRAAPAPDPLYLKKRTTAYWFEYLEDSKTVYFQYNRVRNSGDESLADFCARLFRFIDENDVDRLIVDMRWNGGGNNFLNRPLVHGLIRCEKINRRGGLFVITGRNTFSAAMCGAVEIERHTEAVFVGEPTGSSPNFVGETVPVNLPYSKLRGSISDLYWQNSVAMDFRAWIPPALHAPPSFNLYRLNRDPAIEAINRYSQNNR